MTKRTRLLLAGAAVVLLALIPGSAGASSVGSGHDDGGCNWDKTEAPVSADL
jgi:hypothetical protein